MDESPDQILVICTDNSRQLTRLKSTQTKIISRLDIIQNSINNIDITKQVIYTKEEPDPSKKRCDLCAIIGSIIGAAISGGIALTILLLGESRKKKQERIKLKGYWNDITINVESVLKNLLKQVDEFKKFIADVEMTPHKIIPLYRYTFHQLSSAYSCDSGHLVLF
ncbi:unnamed protein product [marine sediment metagenome]|uniref:Uncharacterized protein n=1 Tax=marine sediment metagenome TaxID=412755 RepID=X1HF25_9ZZZZ